MYIVIHDLDCFVLLCILPEKYTFGFIAHEVDFSWVKIVTDSKSAVNS